jgi:chromosome partitioning protein
VLIADKVPIFMADVPMLVAFKKASAEGKTVADIRNRNAWRAWKAYRSGGKEIVEG